MYESELYLNYGVISFYYYRYVCVKYIYFLFCCREIYIQREKELLEELLSVGDVCGQWQSKQLDLASTHVSLLKHYCHSKRCLHQAEHAYFKASCKKGMNDILLFLIN